MSKEKFRELKQENWSLNKAYQAMVQQFQGTKQQMEEQQLKLKRLKQENTRLKEAAEKSHREGGRNICSYLHFSNFLQAIPAVVGFHLLT